MRHLKTLGVGPSDLIPPISTNMTALTDCPIRCRALALFAMLIKLRKSLRPPTSSTFSPRSLELFAKLTKLCKFFAEAHQAEASRRTDVILTSVPCSIHIQSGSEDVLFLQWTWM